ncbi:MAG: DUF1697 domain-containing protein [Myxococcota bacterium]
MATFIALLRGINVGGNHKLPMAALREQFTTAGATAVRTYIQSGNVVFEAPARRGPTLCRTVSAALEDAFGFPAPIVVRTAADWAALRAENPFAAEAAADPKMVHAMLLDRAPTASARAAFELDCRFGERVHLAKDALYVHYPKGSARSKVTTRTVDAALGRISTGRNWRTVETLSALAAGQSAR